MEMFLSYSFSLKRKFAHRLKRGGMTGSMSLDLVGLKGSETIAYGYMRMNGDAMINAHFK